MMNKIEEFNVDEYIDKVTETKRIFRQSLEKYGKEPQCRQTMEECAELIQAINKFLRYPNDKHYANLIEEIAYMDAALFEIDNMCHALGFDPNGIRKGQKVYEYYRNFFVASGEYKESWEKLVKWGNAAKASNAIVGSYYYVTQKGIDFLSSIYKIKLQPRK